MDDYAIVTDSSCDLSAETAGELGLSVLPLSFSIGGKEYLNELNGQGISHAEFYRRLRSGEPASTAAVNVDSFVRAMEPILQSGKNILDIAFSSGLSNTCHAAQMACAELAEKYPHRKILAVDSLSASMGEGLLLCEAVQKKREGLTIEQLRDWVEENRLHYCHWFTVDDLNHLKRGGRISATTALIGTMLNIKPVLHVDDEGHLVSMGKARGRRASLDALVEHMAQTATDPQDHTAFIGHCDTREDAEYVASEVKRRLGVKNTVIDFVGPVNGTHSGPGTVALFFFGAHR